LKEEYKLKDLVNIADLGEIFRKFSQITGLYADLLFHPGGESLSGGEFEDICSDLIMKSPDSESLCGECRDRIKSVTGKEKGMSVQRCPRGVAMGSAPVFRNGTKLGTVILGAVSAGEAGADQCVTGDQKASSDSLKGNPMATGSGMERSLSFLTEVISALTEAGTDHIQPEEAGKRDSDKRFHNLFEQAADGFLIHDMEGNILEANRAVSELLGYTPEEIRRLNIRDIHYGDKWEESGSEALKQLDRKGKACLEDEFVTKAGDTLVGEVTAATVDTGEGKTVCAVVRDITGRINAERKLLEEKENLRITLQSIGDAVIVTDAEGKITRMNPVAERLTAMKIEVAKGKFLTDVFNIVNARTGKPAVNPIEKVLKSGEISGLANHTMLKAADGSEYQIADSASPIRDSEGKIAGVVLVFRDVTEEYEMRDNLIESEKRYRSLFNSIRDAILVADTDRNIINCNSAFTDLFGYTLDELKGKKTEYLYRDPEQFERMGKKLKGKIGEDNFFHTIDYRKKSGEVFAGETNAFFLRRGRDEIAGFIGLIRDVTRRRQMEEDLGFQSMLLEQIRDLITATDLKGRIVYVNQAVADMFGTSREELIGKTIFEYGEDENRGSTQEEILEETIRKGEWRGEVVNFDSDGEEYILDCRTWKVTDSSGEPVALCSVSMDITERKQAERRIHHLNNMLLAIRNVNQHIVQEDNLDVVIQKSLRELHDIHSYLNCSVGLLEPGRGKIIRKAEVGRYNLTEDWALSPDGEGEGPRCIREALSSGRVEVIEDTSLCPECRYRCKIKSCYSIAIPMIQKGKKTGLLHVLADRDHPFIEDELELLREVADDLAFAREKFLADQALKRRVEFERLISEISQDFVALAPSEATRGIERALESSGKFIGADRSYVFLFREGDELVDNTHEWCADHVDSQIDNLKNIPLYEELPVFAERIRGREAFSFSDISELPAAAEPEKKHFQSQEIKSAVVVPMIMGERLIGFLGFDSVKECRTWRTEDVMLLRLMGSTIAHALERERAETEMLKREKLESLGAVAGGIAHDFNNMLMGVFGNIELAMLNLSEENSSYAPLTEAHRALESVRQLTGRLLTFARGGNPILKTVNMKELVRDSVTFHLSGSRVIPVFDLPDDLWPVRADKGQIGQVVSNLTINSKQAMPSGGKLYIGADNIRDLAKAAGIDLEGEFVRLTIRDEGTGIPDKIIDRIFDPYFTTKQTGSGLGLAVAHSIIERHGGWMTVQSEQEMGATFNIFLRADKESAAQESEEDEKPVKENEEKNHVLLMDDEEMLRRVGSRMLEVCGCTVETASDGKEALNKYRTAGEKGEPFDMVILDLTIPGGMGGQSTVKKIKEIDPKARVIVASGYSSDRILAEYREYGFDGRLAKPFRIEELKREITRVSGEE